MAAATTAPRNRSLIRSEMEIRTSDDGVQEIVAIREHALVDGEWVDVRDLIAAWRAR